MSRSKRWYSAQLDEENCLDLDQILHVFSAPITEEHSWAVIYQSLSCLEQKLDSDGEECYTVATARDILIHTDGSVHGATFTKKRVQRRALMSENAAVADLGVAIYDSLDYSLPEDEQRTLSSDLEMMIDRMISADEDEEVDDEGIGEEMAIKKTGLCEQILDMCRLHLAVKHESDSHYKAVCRALVAEALEISFFLARVNTDGDDKELQELNMKDWASLWGQIMQQLRQGIKLKKINYSNTRSEFGLTPYEMLMEDIKTCRYRLKHVDISPKVKVDAKDKILDFIRSRPPLRPASERVLAPRRRKESTARELILEDIREGTGLQALRKTERKSSTSEREKQRRRKKGVRHVDSILEDAKDSDNSLNISTEEVKKTSPKTLQRKQNRAKSVQFSKSPVQQTTSSQPSRKTSKQRMHKKLSESGLLNNTKIKPSLPPILKPATPRKTSDDKHAWAESLSSLNLNLDELRHIRTQLTKAELEEKNFDADLHSELKTGKTCFICLTVKFGIINWAYNCRICTKYICASCCSTLKLPHDQLKDVTVASLISQLSLPTDITPSPGILSPMSPGAGLLRNTLTRFSFRSSKQSTRPAMVRSKTMGKEEVEQVKDMKLSSQPSTPNQPQLSNLATNPQLTRSNTMGARDIERIKSMRLSQGTNCTVCKDCKLMLMDKIMAMKRGDSVEHRSLML